MKLNKKILIISLILCCSLTLAINFDINPNFNEKVNNLTVCKNPAGKIVADVVCSTPAFKFVVDISDYNSIYKNEDEVIRVQYG